MQQGQKLNKKMAGFFGTEQVICTPAMARKLSAATAHVVIDVQREFCDPDYPDPGGNGIRGTEKTKKVAEHIASYLVPSFRDAGLKTYLVFAFSEAYGENSLQPEICGGGFYRIEPEEGDRLVHKKTDSAFMGGPILKHLRADKIKNILISGFNARSCVHKTVADALQRDFRVCVLKDGVGSDRITPFHAKKLFGTMRREGAVVAHSRDVLSYFSF